MSDALRFSFSASMALALLGATACSKPPEPARPAAPPPAAQTSTVDEELGEPDDPRFIGKIWVSTTPGHARGSLMIFLPDRTLLMDSCFETYRISKWGAAGDRIRWVEEAFPIEASVSMLDENNLQLKLVGQDKVLSYIRASAPYVCPDMPR